MKVYGCLSKIQHDARFHVGLNPENMKREGVTFMKE